MRSNSLDSKLKAKEVELKRHEQEIADQDEVWYMYFCLLKHITHKTFLSTKSLVLVTQALFTRGVVFN